MDNYIQECRLMEKCFTVWCEQWKCSPDSRVAQDEFKCYWDSYQAEGLMPPIAQCV